MLLLGSLRGWPLRRGRSFGGWRDRAFSGEILDHGPYPLDLAEVSVPYLEDDAVAAVDVVQKGAHLAPQGLVSGQGRDDHHVHQVASLHDDVGVLVGHGVEPAQLAGEGGLDEAPYHVQGVVELDAVAAREIGDEPSVMVYQEGAVHGLRLLGSGLGRGPGTGGRCGGGPGECRGSLGLDGLVGLRDMGCRWIRRGAL